MAWIWGPRIWGAWIARRRTGRGAETAAGPGAARRGFLADRRGATAIEFSMLALPFSVLLFATIESCISFAAQEMMANATQDVSRLILTGKLRTVNEATLKTMLCDRMKPLAPSDCATKIIVDLQNYSTFADAASKRFKVVNKVLKIDGGTEVKEPGGPGTKSMLRVFYEWPVKTSFMASWMQTTLANGRMLHFASEVWQNEPFPN